MENKEIKKSTEQEENNVLETSGGEMPDADLKMSKASEVAQVFEQQEKDLKEEDMKKKAS